MVVPVHNDMIRYAPETNMKCGMKQNRVENANLEKILTEQNL